MRTQLWWMVAVAFLTGCTIDTSPQPVPEEQVAQPTPESKVAQPEPEEKVEQPVPEENPRPLRPEYSAALNELVRTTEEEIAGTVGIAIATGDGIFQAGDPAIGSAWSTIKVPIAIAADRENVASKELIDAAITISDNPATVTLFAGIGDKVTAAEKVETLLRENDSDADILSVMKKYEGARVGNSTWTLTRQASFATHLPCMNDASTTYDAMAEIVEWQSDGLGNIVGAHFKGGWSQEFEGPHSYTYRQFGTIPVASGPEEGVVGVAIVAYPDDGSHFTAALMLDSLAAGIAEMESNGDLKPSTSCDMVDGHYHPR